MNEMSEMKTPKMKRVPFDLEKAKAGAKLVTRHGRSARFIAHVPDADPEHRVLALVGYDRFPSAYTQEGTVYSDTDDGHDLVILEEEKEPVIRWLWAFRGNGDLVGSMFTEQEASDYGFGSLVKIEGTATPFQE